MPMISKITPGRLNGVGKVITIPANAIAMNTPVTIVLIFDIASSFLNSYRYFSPDVATNIHICVIFFVTIWTNKTYLNTVTNLQIRFVDRNLA